MEINQKYRSILNKYVLPFNSFCDRIQARLLAKLTTELLVGLFMVYAVVVMTITLGLTRACVDAYKAVPFDVIDILSVTIAWALVAVPGYRLFTYLRSIAPITGREALVTFSCILVVAILAFKTVEVFIVVPHDHAQEEMQTVFDFIADTNRNVPTPINEYITLQTASFKRHVLLFQYLIKESDNKDMGWDKEQMRPDLKLSACNYFAHFSVYDTVRIVVYSYTSDKQKFTLRFERPECDGAIAPSSSVHPADRSSPATVTP